MPTTKSAVGYLSKALARLEDNRMPGRLEGLSLEMFDEMSKHMPFIYKVAFANRWLFGGLKLPTKICPPEPYHWVQVNEFD